MERAIEVSTTLAVPPELARQVLVDDPGSILADAPTADDRRARRFPSALAVSLGTGEVHKEVVVEVGEPGTSAGLASVPLRWRATGPDRLFPIFDGVLETSADGSDASRLTVRGIYTVPLGPVGRFGDGVIGRRLARQSLIAFVEGLAGRLDREAGRREAAVPWRPRPHLVTVQERPSEPRPDGGAPPTGP